MADHPTKHGSHNRGHGRGRFIQPQTSPFPTPPFAGATGAIGGLLGGVGDALQNFATQKRLNQTVGEAFGFTGKNAANAPAQLKPFLNVKIRTLQETPGLSQLFGAKSQVPRGSIFRDPTSGALSAKQGTGLTEIPGVTQTSIAEILGRQNVAGIRSTSGPTVTLFRTKTGDITDQPTAGATIFEGVPSAQALRILMGKERLTLQSKVQDFKGKALGIQQNRLATSQQKASAQIWNNILTIVERAGILELSKEEEKAVNQMAVQAFQNLGKIQKNIDEISKRPIDGTSKAPTKGGAKLPEPFGTTRTLKNTVTGEIITQQKQLDGTWLTVPQ